MTQEKPFRCASCKETLKHGASDWEVIEYNVKGRFEPVMQHKPPRDCATRIRQRYYDARDAMGAK